MSGYERLEDAAYVTVGAVVLAYQRAQVQRRELERWLDQVRRDLAEADHAASPEG